MRKHHAQQARQRAARLRKIRLERRLKALEVLQRLDSLQKRYGLLPAERVLKAGQRNRCQATVALATAALRWQA